MLLTSKLAPLRKHLFKKPTIAVKTLQQIRHGSGPYSYRNAAPDGHLQTGNYYYVVEVVKTTVWYFFLMKFWYDWKMLTKEGHLYPDPRTYTDEELGIPPDDMEGEAFPNGITPINPKRHALYRENPNFWKFPTVRPPNPYIDENDL